MRKPDHQHSFQLQKVVPGSVFVAIPGFAVDGHRFVPEALASGARFVVVERDLGLTNQVVVPSSRKALAALSHSFYDNPSHKLNLIGVTGTNGKTSTVFMLHHVLGHRTGMFSTVKTIVGTTEIPRTAQLQRLWRSTSCFRRWLNGEPSMQ